jgi:tetratricopeptide (TPR) repeat protein
VAAVYLDSLSRANPDDGGTHAVLGEALAALGKRDRAIREARWLDRHNPSAALHEALILVRVGQIDAALAVVERALSKPSLVTVNYLRLDPQWDPIGRNPRAAALLAKYANSGI